MDEIKTTDVVGASLIRGGPVAEECLTLGMFHAECVRDGRVIWTDDFPNTVVTVGKNVILDQALAGSAYTVTGPFMGLIGATPTTVAGDTMASHAGWTEVGNANAPTYTSPRKTAAWSAASAGAKALSSALGFAITSTGTVGGAFFVFFTGAVSTIDNTSGTLLSAGAFSGGNRAVINGDTINVSYTLTLT